jgi:hypothetical protein
VEWAIWSLPSEELANIYQTLSSSIKTNSGEARGLEMYNWNIYKNLVEVQIKNWWQESNQREQTTQVSLTEANNTGARVLVEKNLTDFIYLHFNEGEEQKKQRVYQLIDKLSQVSTLLEQRNGEVQFYLLVMETPPDVLYTRLESTDVKRLAEDFETHMLQRNNLN